MNYRCIDFVSLQPKFTAHPPPAATTISWTPGIADIGDFFYTFLVTSHTSMAGNHPSSA
jgi:hypothetical protein